VNLRIAPISETMNDGRIVWIAASLFVPLWASIAAAQENVWLAVGHGGQRMVSADGKAWTQVGSWSKPGHNQDDLNVAAHFKGAFYVGGGFFTVGADEDAIRT